MTVLADVYKPELWTGFFTMVGGGVAALTGLVFVALSLNLADMTKEATHKWRSINTLAGLTAIFVGCGLVLMGGQHHTAVGVELLMTALVGAVVFLYGFRQAFRIVHPSAPPQARSSFSVNRIASRWRMTVEPAIDRRGQAMSAEGNIQTVQNVYAAFGRADGQTILDSCTDDIDWGTDTSSTVAPWYGIRHGKEQVGAFFVDFGANMEVSAFEPYSFTASDDEVHTMVRMVATRRANGESVSMNLHHFFQFREGKIAFYRGSEDTAQVEAVFVD
jgi:ketosteroid isomerase-like protein